MLPMTTPTPAGDPVDAALLQAKCADLEAQLAALGKELEETKAKQSEAEKFREVAARAQADLQNAKARMERERDELGSFAIGTVLKRLLPVVDNFQRAFGHLPEALKGDEWAKGVSAIEQDLVKILAEIGLKKMESLGQPADPEKHEVLTAGPGAQGVITEVFEDGYELKGKVLRVAKVKVGDGTK